MLRKTSLLITLAMTLFITACAGTSKRDGGAEGNAGLANNGNDNNQLVDTNPWGDSNNAWGTGYTIDQLRALGIDKDPLEYDTVFFEYDSSQITERSQIIIGAHAKFLSSQASKNVVLEGHTDERGTREYNLALGERRAATVQNLMSSIGAGSNSMSAVTYGEERPVSVGQDEQAWQSNRRVQILY